MSYRLLGYYSLIVSLMKNVKLFGRLPYDLEIIEEWCLKQSDATSSLLDCTADKIFGLLLHFKTQKRFLHP